MALEKLNIDVKNSEIEDKTSNISLKNGNKTVEIYNEVAFNYNEDPFTTAMFNVEKEKVLELLDIQENNIVLDFGCGTGKYIELFGKNRGGKIVGMDMSSEMIKQSKKNNSDLEIDYIVGDTSRLSEISDNTFDKINCAQVLKFITSKDKLNKIELNKVFSEFYRVLKPGGSFVFTNNHPERNFDWENFQLKKNPNYIDKNDDKINIELHSLRDYEKACDYSGFKVENISDIEIDNSIGNLFQEGSFDKVKNGRFVIAMKLTKPK